MTAIVPYPTINGVTYQHSSIRLYINGSVFVGITSLNYDHQLMPSKDWGTSPAPIVRTTGKYDANGSMELLPSDYDALIATLGPGYMQVPFVIVVNYAEPPSAAQPAGLFRQDTLNGCRIQRSQRRSTQGEQSIKVQVDLNIMAVFENGNLPLVPFQA